ncbi:MAG: hypothetical protein HYZ37_00475 [Candidatus Solibacter usitatus]|nr:hypothetical protein [Candidatus Solibacter usitatus]
MILRIHWKHGRRAARSVRLARLDTLLARMELRPSGRLPENDAGIGGFLRQFQRVPLDRFLSRPARFYNWNHGPPALRPLEAPLGSTGRTAILCAGFQESAQIRCFPYREAEEVASFAPETLAGPWERLAELAGLALSKRVDLSCVETALIPFTGLKHGRLTARERELLWRAFPVPVFEQFRGFGQELLAWECDAHEGLHIVEENCFFELEDDGELVLSGLGCEEYNLLRVGTELTARIATPPCGCGIATPRLVCLRPREAEAIAV